MILGALLLGGALLWGSGLLAGEPVVVAQAPSKGRGMSIAVATHAALGVSMDSTLSFEIRYQGEVVYPRYGVGGELRTREGLATAFVPYAEFVQGNGNYQVVVENGARSDVGQADVRKWVNFVYLKPYVQDNETFTVDAVLEWGSGGNANQRVVAEGELQLEIRYRGENGTLNQSAHVLNTFTPGDRTFTRVAFPVEDMANFRGEGWYSVHATFDNAQAQGNLGVGNDPTMDLRDPPQHWVWVDAPQDDSDSLIPDLPPGESR